MSKRPENQKPPDVELDPQVEEPTGTFAKKTTFRSFSFVPSTFLFYAILAGSVVVSLSGCRESASPVPTRLAYRRTGIRAGPLARPLASGLRFTVLGRSGYNETEIPVPGVGTHCRLIEQPEGADGATLSPLETITDAAGLAMIDFILGDKPGPYLIECFLPDYPEVEPVRVVIVGGIEIIGSGQDGWNGRTLDNQLSVRLEKAPGIPLGPGEGEIRFALMSPLSGARLSERQSLTDAAGLASTAVRLPDSQGRIDVGISILRGLPGNPSLIEPIVVSFFSIDAAAAAVSLLGGLALFLYGMRMMSESLQVIAGNKLRYFLNLFTTNRFMAVGAGAGVTALIQSSSACTVMVVGFVNAGLMRLEQAIGVVMGANIGTTFTAQIIALKLNRLALPAITVGVALLFLAKRQRLKSWASIVIGFGLLFLGMNLMSNELGQLRESASVVAMFRNLHCAPSPGGFIPFWQFIKAIGCGLVVTLILQSSAATIGLLITIAAAGLIDPYAAFAVLLGDNIGTTITAILASIGTSAAAKRAACFHVTFNVCGVLIMLLLNYIEWPGRPGRPVFMEMANLLTPGDVFVGGENMPRFLANAHTLFNVSCTAVFIPFVFQFSRLCRFLVKPDSAESEEDVDARRILEPHLLSTPYLALRQVWTEVGVMLGKAREAHNNGYVALLRAPTPEWNEGMVRDARTLEEETDELRNAITKYLGGISLTTLNETQSELFPHLVRTVNDAERIADIGKHLSKLASRVNRKSIPLSPEAIDDINQLMSLANAILQLAEKTVNINADGIEISGGGAVLRKTLLDEGKRLEREIKAKSSQLRKNHEGRIENGICNVRAGIVFMDVANSIARSAGCGVNIIEAACHNPASVPFPTNRRISIRGRQEAVHK
ncbi:MAG: Na/Pi cotransporter family protein [Planctomycetota bacterium]|nr:Na/Pi cotransporter family protein [Planctomycetota bacterium]